MRHIGSLFIIINNSAPPDYLMLGWRLRWHFVFVSVYIPEEHFFFFIPERSKRARVCNSWTTIHSLSVPNIKYKLLLRVIVLRCKVLLKAFLTDLLCFFLLRNIDGMLSEGESCRAEMLCGFPLRCGGGAARQ